MIAWKAHLGVTHLIDQPHITDVLLMCSSGSVVSQPISHICIHDPTHLPSKYPQKTHQANPGAFKLEVSL